MIICSDFSFSKFSFHFKTLVSKAFLSQFMYMLNDNGIITHHYETHGSEKYAKQHNSNIKVTEANYIFSPRNIN